MVCSACDSLVNQNANFCNGCGNGTFPNLHTVFVFASFSDPNNDQ